MLEVGLELKQKGTMMTTTNTNTNTNPREKSKQERLGFRVSREMKVLVECAASLQGVSVSDFVISTAYREAKRTIQEHELLRLNRQESEQFARLLLEPPTPNVALRKLMEDT
jgi:uncharacterized protein (DUF1778 family)